MFSKHLPPKIRIQVTRQSLSDPHQQIEENSVDTHIKNLPPLQDFRDAIYTQAERQYLVDLMDLTAGDIKEAIRISGLSQSRLYAILKSTISIDINSHPSNLPNYSCLAVNFAARQEKSAAIR